MAEVFELDHDYETPSIRKAINVSHSYFPSSHTVLESTGTPFGTEITPFIKIESSQIYSNEHEEEADSILRCKSCSAYINPLCRIETMKWTCIICGDDNILTKPDYQRFKCSRETNISIRDYAFDLPHPNKKFLNDISIKINQTNSTPTHIDTSTTSSIGSSANIFTPTTLPPPPKPSQIKMKFSRDNIEKDENNFKFPEESKFTTSTHQKQKNKNTSTVPVSSYSKTFAPAIKRPLVHILLLPERMGPDVLEGIVDSLISGIKMMHPDIQIMLLSYSEVIGVFSLQSYTDESRDNQSLQSVKFASYIKLAEEVLNDFIYDEFENEPRIPGNMYVSIEDSIIDNDPLLDFAEYGLLQEVANFHQTCLPLKSCREALYRALESFGERCLRIASLRSKNKGATNSRRGSATMDNCLVNSDAESAILSVLDWALYYHSNSGEDDKHEHTDNQDNNMNSGYDANNEVGESDDDSIDEERGLWGNVKSWLGFRPKSIGLLNKSGKKLGGPIDDCSGIVLHAFITQEEKLLSPFNETDANMKLHDRYTHLQQVAQECAKRGISINILAVTSHEDQQTNISYLAPLCELSGGHMHKISLHNGAPKARAVFSEKLKRSLGIPLATRCLFKLRTSPIMSTDAVMGHLSPDNTLHDIYYIGGCTPAQTMGALFSYKPNISNKFKHSYGDADGRKFVIIQVAFSYDTLIEANDGLMYNDQSLFETSYHEIAEDYASVLDKSYKSSVHDLLKHAGIPCPEPIVNKDNNTKAYYNFQRSLVAVRRLRILTKYIECSYDVRVIQESCSHSVLSSIMIRRAISLTSTTEQHQQQTKLITNNKKIKEKSMIKKSACKRGEDASILIEKWTAELLATALKYCLNTASVERRSKLNKTAHKSEYIRLLDEIMQVSVLSRLVKVLYGAIVLFCCGYSITPDNEDFSIQYLCFSNDEFMDISSLILTSDSTSLMPLLYPRLYPVEKNFIVKHSKLLARKQAMTSVYTHLFLLDTGLEIMLYNAAAVSVDESFSSNNNNNDSNLDSPTSVNGAVLKNERYISIVIDRIIDNSVLIPKLYFAEAGTESSRVYTARLLEDAINFGMSYKDFLDWIRVKALELVD